MLSARALIVRGGLTLALIASAGPARGQSLSREAPAGVTSPFDHYMDWMLFDEYGWRAMNKGWYDTAQREFTAAIKIAKRPSITDPRLLARSYSALAWSLQKQGRVAEAEPLAKWALDTRLARFGPNAEPVARSLNQMATIYLSQNRFPEAEPLLRQVIAMDRGKSDILGQEQAQSESLLGLGLVAQRRYAEGEKEFGKAVALRGATQGTKNPETGDELNNLAWAQIEQGKLPEARGSMEKALQVLGEGRGQTDPSVARALDGLARIDLEQKDLAAAEIKLRRIITIYEAAGASQADRLRDGLKRYIAVLDQMGRADQAQQVRTRLGKLGVDPVTNPKARASTDANFTVPKAPTAPASAASPAPRGRS